MVCTHEQYFVIRKYFLPQMIQKYKFFANDVKNHQKPFQFLSLRYQYKNRLNLIVYTLLKQTSNSFPSLVKMDEYQTLRLYMRSSAKCSVLSVLVIFPKKDLKPIKKVVILMECNFPNMFSQQPSNIINVKIPQHPQSL